MSGRTDKAPGMEKPQNFLPVKQYPKHYEVPPVFVNSIIIRVISHKSKDTFQVHRHLLVSCSEYIDQLLNNPCLEAKSRTHLRFEEDSRVVRVFVQWLYFGRFFECVELKKDGEGKPGSTSYRHPSEETLCRLWLLGGKNQILSLQNAIIDAIHQRTIDCMRSAEMKDQILDHNSVKVVYENTVPGCKLRRFLVEKYKLLANTNISQSEDWTTWNSSAFLADLAAGFAEMADNGGRSKLQKAAWSTLELRKFYVEPEPSITAILNHQIEPAKVKVKSEPGL